MIVAVIPARGNSKGIRKKNLRFLNGKPLIEYAIKTVLGSSYIDRVIISTEDNEIKKFVERFNVLVRVRPIELTADNITLDPVVYDAISWYESNYNIDVDTIVTVQPTSPLLTSQTLDRAIEHFLSKGYDSLISTVDDTHLFWRKDGKKVFPDYKERLNRQWLPKRLKETGAFIICKRRILNSGSRIGGKIGVFEVPFEESIDIDSDIDWFLCSSLLNRMSITFIVTGNSSVGLGHVRRALTLADFWLGHDITFILYNSTKEVEEQIKYRNYKVKTVLSLREIPNLITSGTLVINDILDTTSEYINSLKSKNVFIVNFEDLGEGADYADIVINALYERINPPSNHKYGYEYECLGENFLLTQPNKFREEVQNILVTFGGADPANLTYKALRALEEIEKGINIRVVIGPAYKWSRKLLNYIDSKWSKKNLKLYSKVENMAEIMENVDLAITSNGRTVYELAAMGIPTISIAQNDRETLHLFARYSRGIEYLGIACNVSEKIIKMKVEELIKNTNKRKLMYESLPIIQLRQGIIRVTRLIENEYRRWKYERDKNW